MKRNIQEGQDSEKDKTKENKGLSLTVRYWIHQEANGQRHEKEILTEIYNQEHKKKENIIQKKCITSFLQVNAHIHEVKKSNP